MGKTCGVMRVEKRKRSDVYGLQIEANRTIEDHIKGRDFDRSDIDWNLTEQNQHLVYTANWGKEITRQIKEAGLKEISKGKNQSVIMLDGLYTSSPEWFDQHTSEEALAFFRDCFQFHVDQYCGGDPSRVINAVIHYDEKTPHMQIASVPILDNGERLRLCAKDIMGGKRDYRNRQDLFYEQVSQSYGMERGEVLEDGEIRLHTTKREWQIATQEERLEAATLKAEMQEAFLQENELKLQTQEKLIENQKIKLENQPHILSKDELKNLSAEPRPVNKLTGKVTLPQEEYQNLLGTKVEAESLSRERIKLKQEQERIQREREYLQIEKTDTLEDARREGLRIGTQEQQELVEKGRRFDEVMELVAEDAALAISFVQALKPRVKKYPELAQIVQKTLDWTENLIKGISLKLGL